MSGGSPRAPSSVLAKSSASRRRQNSMVSIVRALPPNREFTRNERLVTDQELNDGNARLALLCVAQFVVVLDVTIVAIALPAIGDDLGVRRRGSAVGAQRLHADLRRAARCSPAAPPTSTAAGARSGPGCCCSRPPRSAARSPRRRRRSSRCARSRARARRWSRRPRWRCSWRRDDEGPARTRALAVWTAAAAGGGATGWVLGGAISGGLGWEWVFAVNVPIGLAGAVAGGPAAAREPRAGRERASTCPAR